MSQIYAKASGSEPAIPTEFTTDIGTTSGVESAGGKAVPSSNNLNLLARDTNSNNDNGIRTNTEEDESSNLYVELTNRQTSSIQTTDASETNISVFALGATPGVYRFWGTVEAFNSTDTLGAGYKFEAAIRTTGAAAVEITIEVTDNFLEKNDGAGTSMETATIEVTTAANNFVLNVFGIAGKTIDWNSLFEYRFIGAS